ncbi:MAG: SGNH/GDSL hydrolase family protein [Lachnospiraceae bacterium]|jgi:hypothetical protein|nr:SGNH/GDSL hydrolase family protein [Lachnospiraceae bacterium]GFI17714.1 hypothetical protein IMSAGC009_02886 [Lachnospiraceae bacterium]
MKLDMFTIAPGEKPLDRLEANCGFAGIFKKIGIIGDSLSSGEFESHDKDGTILYHDMYEYAWPAVLERLTGTVYRNYSRGGMSAKEFFETWADQNGFWQWNQAYIIALGNNDIFVLNHPIGSVADIHPENPEDNGNTFFGYMGRIVSRLKDIEKDSRIFLVSMQRRGEAEGDPVICAVADEMKKMCGLFSFTYLIDMANDGPVYDEELRKDFALGFHPNAMGYYSYALMIGNYIDYIIRRNPKDFFEVPFIGTGLKNKDIVY